MSKLEDLQLEIPSIDLLEARKLFGGNGYLNTHFEGDRWHYIFIGDGDEFPGFPPEGINDPLIVPPISGIELNLDNLELHHIERGEGKGSGEDGRPDGDDEPDDDDDRGGNDHPDDDRDRGDAKNESNEDNRPSGGGYSGGSGTGDTTDSRMQELLNGLNKQQQELRAKMGISVNINPNLQGTGQYNATTHTITLREYSLSGLISELLHAYQQDLDILNKNESLSNNEFQEHVLTDIWREYASYGNDWGTVKASDRGDYSTWITEITNDGDKSQPFDTGLFQERFEYFFESFREQNADNPYGQESNDEYDWQWEHFFGFLGIQY